MSRRNSGYFVSHPVKVLRAFTTVLFPMKDRHGVGIHLFLKINVSASVIYGNTDVELEGYLLESR